MGNTDLFLERYQHHVELHGFGVPGQQALTHAKVLVVGAGGLGIPAATYLAAMGVGTLGIADTHLITPASLPQQPLFKATQQGEARIDCLAQHLRDLNPEVELHLYEAPLHQDNALAVVGQYQVVVDATNQASRSFLLNDACVLSGIPCVYGAAHQYEGQLSVFNFKEGATFRCLMATPEANAWRQDDNGQGLLGIVPGIVGCYMAAEVVKLLTGIGDVLTNILLTIDVLKNQQRQLKLTPRPENRKIKSFRQHQLPVADWQPREAPDTQFMTPHQLALKLNYQEPVQLIDIREPDDWARYNVEHMLHWPVSNFYYHLGEIHQDLPVVLISRDGQEGRELAGLLNRKHGFGNIYYLEGGMEAWAREVNKLLPGK